MNMNRRLRLGLNFLLVVFVIFVCEHALQHMYEPEIAHTEFELALFKAELNPKFQLKSNANHKTLVLYSYFEKNTDYAKALKYFIELGVDNVDHVDYVFIIQGRRLRVRIPEHSNIKILKRDNDCFDFGAYGKAFEWLGGVDSLRKYDFFVFINPSALGPIVPKYWPSDVHWTEVFTSRLGGDVHACSTSIACLPEDDLGGHGPRIEGSYSFLSSLFIQVHTARRKITKIYTQKIEYC
jgi:hypothetical protein